MILQFFKDKNKRGTDPLLTWSKAIPKSICTNSPFTLSIKIFLVCRSPNPRTCPIMDVVATLRAYLSLYPNHTMGSLCISVKKCLKTGWKRCNSAMKPSRISSGVLAPCLCRHDITLFVQYSAVTSLGLYLNITVNYFNWSTKS